ncbi:MAG TPA: hypothetical protein VFM88_11990 [Vicinamibacteria bacterium]|nr:hypothetical protein [Vicinamibacteria bacterium]
MAQISRRAAAGFVVAILLAGLVRFGLTVSAVPDGLARYASMTVVILAGCLYFGAAGLTWKQLAIVSYVLILPYMAVELAGIGYTWASGQPTIFHAPQYSFGTPIALHFWGHFVGGLTWEPLGLFLMMLLVRAVGSRLQRRASA